MDLEKTFLKAFLKNFEEESFIDDAIPDSDVNPTPVLLVIVITGSLTTGKLLESFTLLLTDLFNFKTAMSKSEFIDITPKIL